MMRRDEVSVAEHDRDVSSPVTSMAPRHSLVVPRGEGAGVAAALDDWEALERLMKVFYEVICFPEGGEPDWLRMEELFSPHARITRITPEGIDYLDLKAFRNLVEEMLELGAFTSFYEQECGRTVQRYGRVFHVASAYESKVSPSALDYLECGVNSLQIIREDAGWRILGLCWDTGAGSTVLTAPASR
jgi:hypothetical protein